jgi:hypothetical protein
MALLRRDSGRDGSRHSKRGLSRDRGLKRRREGDETRDAAHSPCHSIDASIPSFFYVGRSPPLSQLPQDTSREVPCAASGGNNAREAAAIADAALSL